MENLGFVFPFMAVFFIPFLFPNVQQYLYEWMTAYREVVGDSANAKEKLLTTPTLTIICLPPRPST
jgi:hypothetical protein